ncbi:MAG: YbjN domain-containing protein, partial [Gammaproteobacteria bacterium]|nr:YbjN domain-containing protein [Gammaproteobacteria bacterium]
FSTKLIKKTIHEDANAFRLNVMLNAKLIEPKTLSDLYLAINHLNPQVFFGKIYIHSEGALGMSYEIPLIAGITQEQILIYTREFDDAVKNVMAYMEQEGFLDVNDNNDAFVDISKM